MMQNSKIYIRICLHNKAPNSNFLFNAIEIIKISIIFKSNKERLINL